jgi:hypothetical protein
MAIPVMAVAQRPLGHVRVCSIVLPLHYDRRLWRECSPTSAKCLYKNVAVQRNCRLLAIFARATTLARNPLSSRLFVLQRTKTLIAYVYTKLEPMRTPEPARTPQEERHDNQGNRL